MRSHWAPSHCALSLCEERSVPPMFWCANSEAWEDSGWGELFWMFKAQRVTFDNLNMNLKPWRRTQDNAIISIACYFFCIWYLISCVFLSFLLPRVPFSFRLRSQICGPPAHGKDGRTIDARYRLLQQIDFRQVRTRGKQMDWRSVSVFRAFGVLVCFYFHPLFLGFWCTFLTFNFWFLIRLLDYGYYLRCDIDWVWVLLISVLFFCFITLFIFEFFYCEPNVFVEAGRVKQTKQPGFRIRHFVAVSRVLNENLERGRVRSDVPKWPSQCWEYWFNTRKYRRTRNIDIPAAPKGTILTDPALHEAADNARST